MKITTYFYLLAIAFVLGLTTSACGPLSKLTTVPNASTMNKNSFVDLLISLERTACYGTCPVYKITITGDGSVVYEGNDFVEIKGKQTESLDQAKVEELVLAFEQANFFSLQDTYTNHNVTDSPSTITSITYNGKSKTINHYYGDNSAPQELFDLEAKIDEIVNTKQWTGK